MKLAEKRRQGDPGDSVTFDAAYGATVQVSRSKVPLAWPLYQVPYLSTW